MNEDTELRRCAFLRVEPNEDLAFDPLALFTGDDVLVPEIEWRAEAPHLPKTVALTAQELVALGKVSESAWAPRAELAAELGEECLAALRAKGLVLARDEPGVDDAASAVRRDGAVRSMHWHAGSALAHAFSRWSGVDTVAEMGESGLRTVDDMIERFGPPPPHFHRRMDASERIALGAPERTPLDDLLERRATCRNWDLSREVSVAQLATLLKRVFGVQGMEEIAPGAVALKKNHPSPGGLHPTEAYLIVQRVEGLQPGLFHYNVQAHALDRLRALSADEARAFAIVAVAGQRYFADAPVLIVMAARFGRSMWKYRNHPKIYRSILMEMGHISQNLYLTATEMDFGAFITAAINEVQIEDAFRLDPMAEGPLCVCGFGARAQSCVTAELDPSHKVWKT